MRVISFRAIGRSVVLLAFVTLALSHTGCQGNTLETPQDYLEVINDESGGLIHRRTVNGMQLTMRLLPPGYLRAVDQQGQPRDGAPGANTYQSSTTFLMTIDTENESGEAIMQGLSSLGEYDSRVKLLHFGMQEYLSMHVGGSVVKPVLVTLENDTGLRTASNLYVVFAHDVRTLFESSKSVCISFQDPAFGTGINQFCFDSQTVLSHSQIGIAS